MSLLLKLPFLPETGSDAVIAAWHKKAGDAVSRDENLLDLETDKVVLEVPSPVDGVIKEIKVEAGATVTSQQLIAVIEEGAAAAKSEEAPKQDATAGKQAAPAKAGAGKAEAAKPAKAAWPSRWRSSPPSRRCWTGPASRWPAGRSS